MPETTERRLTPTSRAWDYGPMERQRSKLQASLARRQLVR